MYATIFKESTNSYLVYDPYRKGCWRLDKKTLKGYFDYCQEIFQNRIIPMGSNIEPIQEWVRKSRAPKNLTFDTNLLFPKLDEMDSGIVSPPAVALEVTRKCNYKCPYCYAPKETGGGGLSIEEIDTYILQPYLDMGATHFALTGGEPLLKAKKTFTIAQRIRDGALKRGMKPFIGILTNGWKFADRITEIVDAGITHVQVSISSLQQEKDSLLRGVPRGLASVAEAKRAVKASVDHGLFVETNTILVAPNGERPSNIDDIEEIAECFIGYGVDIIRFIPVVPGGRARNVPDFGLNPPEVSAIVRAVRRIRDRYADCTTMWADTGGTFLDCPFELPIEGHRPVCCRAGVWMQYIDVDGNSYPCNNLVCKEFRCNDRPVDEQSPLTVWYQSPLLKNFRDILTASINEKCQACELRSVCVGECRAFCWYRYGKLDLKEAPSPCYRDLYPYDDRHHQGHSWRIEQEGSPGKQ